MGKSFIVYAVIMRNVWQCQTILNGVCSYQLFLSNSIFFLAAKELKFVISHVHEIFVEVA